jgi:hypothetical protein
MIILSTRIWIYFMQMVRLCRHGQAESRIDGGVTRLLPMHCCCSTSFRYGNFVVVPSAGRTFNLLCLEEVRGCSSSAPNSLNFPSVSSQISNSGFFFFSIFRACLNECAAVIREFATPLYNRMNCMNCWFFCISVSYIDARNSHTEIE